MTASAGNFSISMILWVDGGFHRNFEEFKGKTYAKKV
jgi:hypothetical protein